MDLCAGYQEYKGVGNLVELPNQVLQASEGAPPQNTSTKHINKSFF